MDLYSLATRYIYSKYSKDVIVSPNVPYNLSHISGFTKSQDFTSECVI